MLFHDKNCNKDYVDNQSCFLWDVGVVLWLMFWWKTTPWNKTIYVVVFLHRKHHCFLFIWMVQEEVALCCSVEKWNGSRKLFLCWTHAVVFCSVCVRMVHHSSEDVRVCVHDLVHILYSSFYTMNVCVKVVPILQSTFFVRCMDFYCIC